LKPFRFGASADPSGADGSRPSSDAHGYYDSPLIDVSELDYEGVPVTETDENRALLRVIREVIDPEIGLNIVDLGLVYAVAQAGERVHVVVTMTTPACPLSAVIEEDIRQTVLGNVAGVALVDVSVVFHPPWSPDMMSDQARAHFGI